MTGHQGEELPGAARPWTICLWTKQERCKLPFATRMGGGWGGGEPLLQQLSLILTRTAVSEGTFRGGGPRVRLLPEPQLSEIFLPPFRGVTVKPRSSPLPSPVASLEMHEDRCPQ